MERAVPYFLLSIVFASVTDSTLINVLPVYIQDTVGSNLATGWMITGLTVASMVTRLVCGPLTDKFGRKRLVVIGSSAYAINALAYCFASNIKAVFFLRVLNGITQGIYFPVPPMLVADLVPENRLVDGMGFFGVASSVRFAVAPTISLAVYKSLGTTAFFWWITVTAVISAVLTMLIQIKAPERAVGLENQPKQARPRFGLHTLFDGSVLGLGMVSLLLALGTAAVANFTMAYGLSKGIENIGLFTLTTSLAGLFTKVLVGRLTARFTKGGLVAAGCVLSGLATVVLGLSESLALMLAAAVLYGMGTAVTGQLLQVLVIERVADDRRGVAMSTYSLLGDVGSGAGGMAAGGISQRMGYTACYLLAGTMMGIAGMVQSLQGRRNHKGDEPMAERDKTHIR